MTIRGRAWLTLTLAGLAPLVLFSWFAFGVAYNGLAIRIENQLMQQAETERQLVADFVDRNRERLRLVTSRTQLRLSLAACLDAPAPVQVEKMERILNDAKESIQSFKSILILGEDGAIIASTDPQQRGENLAGDPLFIHALEATEGCEFVSGPGGGLRTRLAGTLTLEERRLGIAIIELDARRFLDRVCKVKLLGESADVILVQRAFDGEVRYLRPADSVSAAGGRMLTDLALAGRSELFPNATRFHDGAPVRVMAATVYASDANVGVVVHVGRAEALEPARRLLWGASLAVGFGILCFVGAKVLFTRSISEPLLDLVGAARRLAAGDTEARANCRGEGEMESLRSEFNRMADEMTDAARVLEERVKKRTEELRIANESLQRSNRELADFAYVASHDLKEPLRVVKSYSDLLRKRFGGQLDEKGARYLTHITNAATRMGRLISDLLDYSRVNTRGRPLERIDANDALDDALDNLEIAIRDSGAKIKKTGSLPAVLADRTQLVQLLQNLIANAIKFCEKAPEIEISARRRAGCPERWEIAVSDNGPGIPKEYQAKIFEIFERVVANREVEGTGMGLAICHRILERHGGEIRVESESGQGARFVFTLEDAGPKAPPGE